MQRLDSLHTPGNQATGAVLMDVLHHRPDLLRIVGNHFLANQLGCNRIRIQRAQRLLETGLRAVFVQKLQHASLGVQNGSERIRRLLNIRPAAAGLKL